MRDGSVVAEFKALLRTAPLVLYAAWCVGISGFALGSFVQIIQQVLAVRYDYMTEMMVVVAQVFFQWLFMLRSSWEERVRYGFLALSVSMIGSVMLLPLLLYHGAYTVSAFAAIVYFFVVVGTIFLIHCHLVKEEELPQILTVTWVVYRALLLAFVLLPRAI